MKPEVLLNSKGKSFQRVNVPVMQFLYTRLNTLETLVASCQFYVK